VKNNLKNQGAAGSVFLFLVIIVAVILLLVCGEDTHKFKIPTLMILIFILHTAHFSGASKNINNYQIIFQPFPFVPFAGDNSTTLNFSILDSNNSNVNNVYSALVITEKIRTKY
jgi:hypothetical protein